jgi:NitT/TauT family transport system substrate-binding protein
VDALNYNNTWIDLLEMSGTPARRIELPDVYEKMINNAYVTHRDTLAEKPEVLAGFGRALAKATLVCHLDPALCVETFWRLYPESVPAEGTREENLARAVELLERRLALVVPAEIGGAGSWGRFDHEAIGNYVTFMHEAGEFARGDLPVEAIFSNDLADAFVAFDEADVRADIAARR